MTSVVWLGEGNSAAAAPAELISVAPGGSGPLSSFDYDPSVSGDGNIVVFNSNDFVASTFFEDVYVRNRATGTTTHVPQPALLFGVPLARTSGGVVSKDGCQVVFWGLYYFDFPAGEWNIYKWNRCSPGSISVEIAGGVLDDSATPQPLAVSADGRYVAYMAPPLTGGPPRIARIDTNTGLQDVLTVPVTVTRNLDISDDGRFLAIAVQRSVAGAVSNQVLGWTPPCLNSCTTEVISVNDAGQLATGFSNRPSVSADGRYVAFESSGPELANLPPGSPTQVYVRDRVAGITRLVTDTPGQAMQGGSTGVGDPEITPDGSQVALTQSDNFENTQVFVARTTSGFFNTSALDLVSYGVNDQPVSNGAGDPSMSSNGRYVAFSSSSSDELSGGTIAAFQGEAWMRERPIALDVTATLNFGTIDVGSQSAPQNAVVTNTSGVLINIAGVTPPTAPFSITANSCGGVLAPGASCVVTLVFAPTAVGGASSTVTVLGDGLSVSSSLVGTGRALPTAGSLTIAPAAADFGSILVGSTSTATSFAVSNPGQTAVSFSGVSLSGVGADQFTIVSNTCTGSLASGASCSIIVSATATREGAFSATLSVLGTGGQAAQATLRVIGTTIVTVTEVFTPTLKMNPGVVSAGEVTVAIGEGFPPNIAVALAFAGEFPFATVQTDAEGAFRFNFLVLRNGVRIGGKQVVAVDQPLFTGVFAPLLIELASYRPSGFASPAITAGVRSLFSRGG